MATSMQRILFLLTLLVGLNQFGQAQAPYEMLWEVRHPSQPRPSYLFGTMHISDNRVFNLPDSVILAIQNTDGMAFELDFDSASYYTLEYLMRGGEFSLDDFDQLAARLNPQSSFEDVLERVRESLNRDDDDEEEDDKAPTEDPADLGPENSVLFLDAFLFRVGRDLGKQRCGLEKVDDQFRLLYGADGEPSVLAQAKSSIRSGDLTKAYLAGNLRKIETWLEEGKMFDPKSRKLLLDDRNIGMARGADSLMRLRPTFVGVGAGHLPGKAGVIALLRERGYTLRPVLATQRTGMARAVKATPYKPIWQTFRNEAAGYALQVPCRPYKANFTDLPVPMYVGMDFPGGWVYYFFAFSTDMAAANTDKTALRKNLLTSLLESMEVEGTPYPVQSGDLSGEEAIVRHDDQSLRIRAVSSDNMVFVIFAGIDEEIVRNPMLDTMFNSLVTFPALPLSQRAWTTRIDSLGGFSMPMPAETARLVEGATQEDTDPHFYKVFFKADDEQTKEDFFLTYAMVESQILAEYDPLDRLVDSISYAYDYATIKDERDFEVDGFRAHEFILDLDGVNTGIYRCVQRGDRLYMYGGTYSDQAESKSRILSALDAFHFLPYRPSPLRHRLSTPTFTAKFPAPARPYYNETDESTFWSSYGGDSTQTWSAVDPRTGAYHFLSKVDFPAWTSLDSLTQLFAEFNGPVEERKDIYIRAVQMPGALAASERLTETLDKRSALYNRMWMQGQSLYWYYCTVEDGDESHVRAFVDGIQLLPVPAFDWTSSKIDRIIQAMQSEDADSVYDATNALFNHRMDASIRQPLLGYLGQLAAKQEAPEHAFSIVDAICLSPSAGDPEAYRDLVLRFGFAPEMQTHLIGSMFYQDTLGLPQAAIKLLDEVRPRPSDPLDIEDMAVRIEYHLQESQDAIASYDALAFMLDVPAYQGEFLYLTETMGGIGELEARHTGVFRAKFQDLAEAWIAQPQYDPNNGGLSYNYDYLISALNLADPDARSYALLERIMDMGDPRVEEYAVLMLLDADQEVPKARLIHLLDQPGYSESLLYWLWSHDQQKRVPKKYWKRDRLALAILQDRLIYSSEQGPSQIELLEKIPLVWDEKDQFLYVYRVGWEDKEDWEIAFSGPFPQDGKFDSFEFDLSGSDGKVWTPQRQQDLIDEWLESAQSAMQWDE